MTPSPSPISDCRRLGELHARHARLLDRAAEPAVAAEMQALEVEMGQVVTRLAARTTGPAVVHQAAA